VGEEMIVQVYKNLHKGCFSVRNKKTGKVIAYTNAITLINCRLVVGKKGRERVLRERQKNVHAFIEGELVSLFENSNHKWSVEIFYDPYLVADWTTRNKKKETWTSCKVAHLSDGKVRILPT
jgi:hypothetical protein